MSIVVVGHCAACGQPLTEERDHRLKMQPTDVSREVWPTVVLMIAPVTEPVEEEPAEPDPAPTAESWLERHSSIYRYFKGGK